MAKVLVIGSGGREHALCWRLKQAPSVSEVICSPGNGGISQDVACVNLGSHAEIISYCKKNHIDLVVIGPEQPLVEGLSDALEDAHIPAFGPRANAARLEGSKGYMKDICQKYNIPTAAYRYCHSEAEALAYLKTQQAPIVVKADGLAAGKGVIIAENMQQAEDAVKDMFAGNFGESGKAVVIEEYMEGPEVSYFALSDGKTAIEFAYAQDHKRVGDGDTGPNTGGMGAYSPPSVMTEALRKEVMETIIHPTVSAMQKEGAPFQGVLFAGLMLTASGPKLLEYNVRFGDPETQSMMMRFTGDLFQVLHACATGKLQEAKLAFTPEASVCVVMAASGYPGAYDKGTLIGGLEKAAAVPGAKIFHAGTAEKDGNIIATGGRVLGVTALGKTIAEAQKNAYAAIDAIHWPEGFCRRDIAWREIAA
ncbi:MAG: phosphoribosylamine--glycine ligase [Rickettsiales bacterium]|nr:phosphoribosylamine--glycine ligase [Rickettsiales bacterium]